MPKDLMIEARHLRIGDQMLHPSMEGFVVRVEDHKCRRGETPGIDIYVDVDGKIQDGCATYGFTFPVRRV